MFVACSNEVRHTIHDLPLLPFGFDPKGKFLPALIVNGAEKCTAVGNQHFLKQCDRRKIQLFMHGRVIGG